MDDRIVYRRDVDGLPGLDEAFVYLANAYLSVFGLADATGAIVEAYDYTAFGRPFVISAGPDGIFFTADDDRVPLGNASGNGAGNGVGAGAGSFFGNPYLFQSRRWEPALGLYDYRARFFDPFTEVWLTRDAAGFVNGSNLYQFVGSMPWILDPMGLCGRERSWNEHFRDGAAGFLDGALSGLTFGLYEDNLAAELMGADPNSPAYMVGNVAGNIVGGAVVSAATGGAAACGQVARWAKVAAKGLRMVEKAVSIRDGIMGAIDTAQMLYTAWRCGDPSVIADMAVGYAQSKIVGKSVVSRVFRYFLLSVWSKGLEMGSLMGVVTRSDVPPVGLLPFSPRKKNLD